MRVLVLTVVLSLLMVMPVQAASDDSGWDIWDVISGIGGYFIELFDTIRSAVTSILNGLKNLFIPSQNYFSAMQERLQSKLAEKFGGIQSVIQYLGDAFGNLRSYRNVPDQFVLRFPSGHFLHGASVNLLSGFSGVLVMIRTALSGFVSLMSVAICYRRITAMINT